MQSLYNPDRLRTPLVLAGPKGSGDYRPISWEEAVGRLADRLRTVRSDPGPQSVAVVLDADRGLKRLLFSRFLQSYGSNNLIDWAFQEGHQAYPAQWAMQGLRRAVGYDLARARYVLSFGSQWLDAHWSPAQASLAFAELRRPDETVRRRFVHVEARLSLTGAKADEWIPVRPGTEGALALGLAHVILREGLYDREFIERFSYGFEDPTGGTGERLGFRRLVLRDYAPARVGEITGIPEGTIFRLAREFATHRPAVAIGYDGSGVSMQRSYDRMAIQSLNALVGSIDVPGGVVHFQDIPSLSVPMPEPDRVAERGLAKPRLDQADLSSFPLGDLSPHLLADRILADMPYPIDTLVLAGVNPVFDSPHPERMKQALAKVPFVVSLSPWLDDSTRWADLVIPDTHFLSQWGVDFSHTLAAHPTVTIGQPVVAAPEGLHSSVDLILELARRVGDPVTPAFPFKDSASVVRAICDSLFAAERGGPFGPPEQEMWTRLLERGGWRSSPAASSDSFYKQVVRSGGWSDPIYYYREWDRVFRSPRRRFAFHSAVIADRIQPGTAAEDLRCLPHYEPVHRIGQDDPFPLQLYVYPIPLLAGMNDVNVPWLMDAAGAVMLERWRSWVEINPTTAGEKGIVEGDTVVVSSNRGRMRVRAKLFEGIRPDVVAIPYGLGHEGGGRWSDGIGDNPAVLVDVLTDALTSEPFWNATRVSIEKA